MNANTKRAIENPRFDALFQKLSSDHKPQKATLDTRRLELLGYFVVRFQRLEQTILRLIKIFADVDQIDARILSAKYSFKNALDVVAALAVQRHLADIDDLQFLIRLASKAEDIRNQLIHSHWSAGPRFKDNVDRTKGLVTKVEDYADDELQQICEWVDRLDTSLDAVCFRYITQCEAAGIALKNVRFIKS